MAEYTKVFENPYPNGWEDLPSENTPITAHALQEHTDAIENIEKYLEDNPIEKATDVQWNQLVTDGTKIAEITIGGEKTDVYAKGGGGGGTSFEVGNELNLENDVLSYKANFGTTSEFETFKQDESVPIGATYHVTDDFVDGGGNVYDGTERVIGTWFGKPLYRKVLNFGAMPNATRKFVNHNISNLSYVLNLYGFAYAPSGYIRIPHTVYDNLPYSNYITINSTQVSISCGTDRSSMNCYVVIEYTKVGD